MTTYPSKISYGLLVAVGIILFLPISFEGLKNGLSDHFLVTIAFLLVVYLFVIYIFFSTKYTINQTHLHVKCSFLYNQQIRIYDIKSIEPSKSLLSSPAASLDRIKVTFGKYDEILLSPKDKYEFVKHLKQINPNIESSISRL